MRNIAVVVFVSLLAVSGLALAQSGEQKNSRSSGMEHMKDSEMGGGQMMGMMKMMGQMSKMMDQCSSMMDSMASSRNPKGSDKRQKQ